MKKVIFISLFLVIICFIKTGNSQSTSVVTDTNGVTTRTFTNGSVIRYFKNELLAKVDTIRLKTDPNFVNEVYRYLDLKNISVLNFITYEDTARFKGNNGLMYLQIKDTTKDAFDYLDILMRTSYFLHIELHQAGSLLNRKL